ncbi:hypothetical protein JWG40_19465 [Leptospira sp. 201903074]|uniref:DUF6933 domain-containing protein n=1 Tax=Leptospira abararensis TaxID=2810036 RepID=UPI0019663FF3|nr:hypothetical protein [Leptospira abararensis]MBM9549210.1 hypothetical protein [Leptospira abararensis]
MILRLTKRVQDNFKLKNLKPIPESNLENEWYVNTFTAGRLKYYLVTHAETLFSVIFRGAGIRTEEEFLDRILEEWKHQLEGECLPTVIGNLLAPMSKEIYITTTLNRRVLGSMTDMIQMTKFILKDEPNGDESSPFAHSKFLNKTPFSYLGMDTPTKRIQKYKT